MMGLARETPSQEDIVNITPAQIEAADGHLVTVKVSTLLHDSSEGEDVEGFTTTLTGFLSDIFYHEGRGSFQVTSGRESGLLIMDFEVETFTDHGTCQDYRRLLDNLEGVLAEAQSTVKSAGDTLDVLWQSIIDSVR